MSGQLDEILEEFKAKLHGEAKAKKGDLVAELKAFGLSEAEIRELAGFKHGPAWRPLMLLFRFIQRANDDILRSHTSIDTIWRVQGRTQQLNELAGLLHSDLPLCFNPGAASKGGA